MRKRLGYVRSGSVSFDATFSDSTGNELFRAVQTEREIRLTLGTGEAWPDYVRRGRRVDLEMGLGDATYRLSGRVRFRRLQTAVILGQMERLSA